MTETQRRRLLIGLVVAFVVLGELWLVASFDFQLGESLWKFWLVSIVQAHTGLVCLWAALSGKARPWRLVAAILGLVLLMYLGENRVLALGHEAAIWYFLALLALGLQTSLLMIGRFLGIELTNIFSSEEPDDAADQQWMQYSIGAVLSWTTAVAVVMAALRYLPKELQRFASDSDTLLIFAAIVLGATAISLGSIWISLGSRRAAARFVMLAVCTVVAIAALLSTVDNSLDSITSGIAVLCLSQVFWLTAALSLVRLAGYRLIWRRRVRF